MNEKQKAAVQHTTLYKTLKKAKNFTKKEQHDIAALQAACRMADAFRSMIWHAENARDQRKKKGTFELVTYVAKDKIFPHTVIGCCLRGGVATLRLANLRKKNK